MKLGVLCGHHGEKQLFQSEAAGSLRCAPAEEELGSDGDCVAHSPAPVGSSSSSSSSSSKSKPYTRRPKPPFSYIALIAMAIRDSPSGRLTLAEINDYLMKKFPFFSGSYTGWRNSVRHNLSLNDCFLKVLRDPSRPWGKDNFWMLNPHSEYTFADGVFRRRRKRINKETFIREPQKSPPQSGAKSGAKFSSSFAIDSILSTPFERHSHSTPALRWPVFPQLNPPASPPYVTSAQHMDAAHAPDAFGSHPFVRHC